MSVLDRFRLGGHVAVVTGASSGLGVAPQWTRRKGIRVNALAPGLFETETSESCPAGSVDTQLGRVAVGRQGDPEELAATLVWLVSPAGGYVTGHAVVVDGGDTIGWAMGARRIWCHQ